MRRSDEETRRRGDEETRISLYNQSLILSHAVDSFVREVRRRNRPQGCPEP